MLGRIVVSVVLCACIAAAALQKIRNGANPVADPHSQLILGRVRITFLTERMVRVELAKKLASFDDRPTLAVINRKLPPPTFNVTRPNSTTAVLQTKLLRITHDTSTLPAMGAFTPSSLHIELLHPGSGVVFATWSPGMQDPNNLNGTMDEGPSFAGGLDCYSQPNDCKYDEIIGRGLLSRSGWAIANDTNTTRFLSEEEDKDEGGAVTPVSMQWVDGKSTREAGRTLFDDFYFLAHAKTTSKHTASTSGAATPLAPPLMDYAATLHDWALVSGRSALPPKDALGVWYSKYYPYSSTTMPRDVVDGYASHGLPLSVVVLDVDWHTSQYAKDGKGQWVDCNGWGGFTPNSTLFPESTGGLPALLDELHARGLRTILSLHLQTGMDHCEGKYTIMAKAMRLGNDFVAKNRTIDCAMDNKTFVAALLGEVMRIYGDTDSLRI
jgi:alpha-glucosidase